ncbi:MAG: HAD family hydrolase [Anaerolineae bacterium]|nr:HAD family hydrolase [Anaerolineae bacterium]
MQSSSRFLPGSQIEIIRPETQGGAIRHALFDFDGTISLIREGWQGIMIPMMVEILLGTPNHEALAEVERVVKEYVARLTGKQTIYQMIQLSEEIVRRGGTPLAPAYYKDLYHERLSDHIRNRIADLKSGRAQPEDLSVPGSIRWLDVMKKHGVMCYLASGTDQQFVDEEAALLGLTDYFEGIYGAQEDYVNFSKKMVIDRIIQAYQLHGRNFVAFGDGYVEIEDTKSVEGIAVGVASDEKNRCGVDEWKRSRLISAGADLIIPDFREISRLENYLFPNHRV